jgi:ankyrin repeat protein
MERIEGQVKDEVKLAKDVLLWIACTKRPLTTLELQMGLAVESGDLQLNEEKLCEIEDIISVCAGLVTVDEESCIIRLVHYTTQQYFERTWTSWFPNAQTDITTTCVTYLSFNNFETGFCPTDEKFEERLQLNPLYDYAARNWGHHAHTASAEVAELILDFLESEPKVSASTQAMMASKHFSRDLGYSQRVPKRMAGVHLAAYFGLKEAMTTLLKKGHDLDSKNSYGRTPLSHAAGNGHEAVVKLLLKKGAELENKDTKYGRTPLSRAAENSREAVVRLLMKGAELDTRDESSYGRTPLSYAASHGHEAMVKLLLEAGTKLLSYAALCGHGALVKLLLEKGAELEAKSDWDQTPLSWAAWRGHEAVVKLLLEKGAELETKGKWGQTPLSYAASSGHEAVVKLLLEEGAVRDTKDSYGQTPLLHAAEIGHEAVVKLLLEKGAELESKDIYNSQTPLSYSAWNGFEAAVMKPVLEITLLLEKGAKKPQ